MSEEILNKLSIIRENSLKKRLAREIHNLIKNCDFNLDYIDIYENEDTLQDSKNFPYKLSTCAKWPSAFLLFFQLHVNCTFVFWHFGCPLRVLNINCVHARPSC